ncbi:uncharacterized protein DNG_09604 [Cephalotrichum gorgonifer]|uniref:Uncharacterized protein n=1 Tax=Cephalotrichum gorgonifer TaxID=2041049 RepID=A0AAE8N8L5_9PEZI|nr:uncharacterized protein DNG_09604 [Cephalotrichum gorgonifer]
MYSPILEERADDPALRDSYLGTPTTAPAAKKSDPSINTDSTTLISAPEKSYNGSIHTTAYPPTPLSQNDQGANPFDTDLEAMISSDSRRKSLTAKRDDARVWPSKEHWKNKAKEAKKGRGNCACMASLSRRTRIAVKVAIGLLIVGVAVGIGFGISKPLGAPIWGDKSHEQ